MVAVLSCSKRNKSYDLTEEELNSKIGKEMVLPLLPTAKLKEKFKIVSYINGDCYSCVEELKLWEKLIQETEISEEFDVDYVFYVFSSDFEFLKKNYDFFSKDKIIVMCDKDKEFFFRNSLSVNKLLHSFLLDDKNKILLVGNPVLSKSVKSLYLKLLSGDI